MPGPWGANGRKKKCVWSGERLVRGFSSESTPGAKSVALEIHQRLDLQKTKLWTSGQESPCMFSPDSPCKFSLTISHSESTGGWRGRSFFPSLCCILISLTLNWLVCQIAKHLLLERIRLIKERLFSKRWEVCHLLRSDSSENGCLDFPVSVYGSCQIMLGLGNHPAGDHIMELTLSINIDKNKVD